MSTIRDQVEYVIVNNEVSLIQPNSCKFNPGTGEKKVESFSKGEGQVETVTAVDISTMIGKVSFSLPNDSTSKSKAIEWSKSRANLVKVVCQSGKIYILENAELNSPDITGGSDTNIELEFIGSPIKG